MRFMLSGPVPVANLDRFSDRACWSVPTHHFFIFKVYAGLERNPKVFCCESSGLSSRKAHKTFQMRLKALLALLEHANWSLMAVKSVML